MKLSLRHPNRIPTEQKEQVYELCVFLFLIVPSMLLSFLVVKQGSFPFVIAAYATISRDLALISLIFFFLWRNGEPVIRIGLSGKHLWKDIGLGVVLFLPVSFGSDLLEKLLRTFGFSTPSTPLPSFLAAKSSFEFICAFILVVVVALTEEIIFRGYLILRLRAVTSSSAAAVLLSSVVFSLGHGYEGSAGVITVGAMGLAFALIYLWRQSLVAPITMHFLQDFLGIVLFPALGIK